MRPAAFDPDQLRCLAVLTAAWPIHNLPVARTARTPRDPLDVIEWCHAPHASATVTLQPGVSLATFDADHLTRLVRAAHEQRVRLDIDATRYGRLRLMLHARAAEADNRWQRHPGLEVFHG